MDKKKLAQLLDAEIDRITDELIFERRRVHRTRPTHRTRRTQPMRRRVSCSTSPACRT
jgi:hypothetical protein